MEHTAFIGRNEELDFLLSELSQDRSNRSSHRLYIISGPEGIGKKFLLTHLRKALDGNDEKRLIISLPSPKNSSGWPGLVESLLSGMDSPNSEIIDTIQNFHHDYVQKIKLIHESQEDANIDAAIYTDVWMELFQLYFVKGDTGTKLQVLFILPDFDYLENQARRLFVQLILAPLARRSNSPDSRFFITIEKEQDDLSDLKSHFKISNSVAGTIALQPFDLSDVEEWLEEEEIPTGIAENLYQSSSGIPGKMIAQVDLILEEENLQKWLATADIILNGLNESETEHITVAAMLPQITDETLLLYYNKETAKEIIRQIRKHPKLQYQDKDNTLTLGKDTARSLQKWFEKRKPEAYKNAKLKAEQLRQIITIIPTREARNTLTDLAPFTFFNNQVLSDVIGGKTKQILEFVKKNHKFFEITAGNYKITQGTRDALNRYLSLTGRKPSGDILKRIADCWHKTRGKILDDINRTEEKIKTQEKDLKSLKTEMRKLDKNISTEQAHIDKYTHKPEKHKTSAPQQQKSIGFSILLQLLGIIILYFSILFTEKVSIGYAIIGVGFIFGGLFIQTKKSPVPATHTTHPTPPIDTSKYEKNIHFLNIKKTQLKSKITSTVTNIQRCKSNLVEYDNLLRQPYN